jgi:hypothetical protein
MYVRSFQKKEKQTITMGQTAILVAQQFTINHMQHAHSQTLLNNTNAPVVGNQVVYGQNHFKWEFWRVQKLGRRVSDRKSLFQRQAR